MDTRKKTSAWHALSMFVIFSLYEHVHTIHDPSMVSYENLLFFHPARLLSSSPICTCMWDAKAGQLLRCFHHGWHSNAFNSIWIHSILPEEEFFKNTRVIVSMGMTHMMHHGPQNKVTFYIVNESLRVLVK